MVASSPISPSRGRRRRTVATIRARGAVGLVLTIAFTLPAHAQQVVYDPSAVGKLIEQARTELQQLEQLKAQLAQGKQLYDAFNHASDVNSVASLLSAPPLRALLPDAQLFIGAAKGDLGALGQIGARAARIRSQSRLYTPLAGDAQGEALEATGARAARDLALGETVADAGAQRLIGLQQLQTALGTAPNVRALMDIQARLTAEQAMIANDQMRLQGLAMAQAAEDRLARQQALERIAAANAARLKLYRSGFQ